MFAIAALCIIILVTILVIVIMVPAIGNPDIEYVRKQLKATELELKVSQDKVKLLQAELNAYRIIDDWDKRKEVEQAFLNDKDSE